jgi:hypothetical protein
MQLNFVPYAPAVAVLCVVAMIVMRYRIPWLTWLLTGVVVAIAVFMFLQPLPHPAAGAMMAQTLLPALVTIVALLAIIVYRARKVG